MDILVLNPEIGKLMENIKLYIIDVCINLIMYSTSEADCTYKSKLLNICYVIDDLGVQRIMSDTLQTFCHNLKMVLNIVYSTTNLIYD